MFLTYKMMWCNFTSPSNMCWLSVWCHMIKVKDCNLHTSRQCSKGENRRVVTKAIKRLGPRQFRNDLNSYKGILGTQQLNLSRKVIDTWNSVCLIFKCSKYQDCGGRNIKGVLHSFCRVWLKPKPSWLERSVQLSPQFTGSVKAWFSATALSILMGILSTEDQGLYCSEYLHKHNRR